MDNRFSFKVRSVASLGLALAVLVSPVMAQGVPADIRKDVIESPVKKIIRSSNDVSGGIFESPVSKLVKGAADVRKSDIESPLEKTIGALSSPAGNPKVAPGKVRWHADFATACAASRQTGRPVLLFQMMGNLDDEFC